MFLFLLFLCMHHNKQKTFFCASMTMGFSNHGKFCTVFCILLQISIVAITTTVGAKSRAWEGTLVFQEDFEGKSLSSKWEKIGSCEGKGHKDTNLECFTDRYENVRVTDGRLVIQAQPEDYIPDQLWVKPKNYTSGRVKMTNDLGYLYGSYVVRARLAKGSHLLSSIYLLPAYQDHDNCKYEEIDVAQGRGQRTSSVRVGAAFGRRWNHASAKMTERVFRNVDFSGEFHEFALVWKKHRMEWFVDGRLVNTVPMFYYSDWLLPDESNLPCNYNKKLFQQNLQLNLGLSVGGSLFPEEAYGDLTYKQAVNWTKPTFEIDWVKIYQFNE